jgi:nitroreductase
VSKAVIVLVVSIVLGACSGGPRGAPSPVATGAPEVSPALVTTHAAEFDAEVPERHPGSDQEFAAASYILGHLQLAGYGTFLDAVPVEDLVRSTNVVAFPSAGDPTRLVVVDYGTAPGRDPDPTSIGLLLELARALQVVEPDHSVGFVALGAAAPADDEISLGARRLARFLQERALEPTIVQLEVSIDGPPGKAYGAFSDAINCPMGDCGPTTLEAAYTPNSLLWEKAGLDLTIIRGSAADAAPALMTWLTT